MLDNAESHTDQPSAVSSAPVVSDLKPVMTGLSPAFRESTTGEVHLSREKNGKLSQDHCFFHLPEHWIGECDSSGEAMSLIPTIEAGYWRSTGFIAIKKSIQLPLDS
ncbi:MAG: hypothetical protein V3U65_19590 [Granulosicoccaceae bacterium]